MRTPLNTEYRNFDNLNYNKCINNNFKLKFTIQ